MRWTQRRSGSEHREGATARWRNRLSQRRLVKECERLLADLPMPVPFSVDALVRTMEQALERRIRLIPMGDAQAALGTACGLRIKTPEFTAVLYRQRQTHNQTEHIILHELVHEWLDHGTNLTHAQIAQYVPEHFRQDLLRRFPEAMIQGRVNYKTPEERVAEVSASVIKLWARRRPIGGDDMVSLLESSLSHPVAPPTRSKP
ncbi:hypothetical protein ACFWBI_21445 [Streptomyces sp. NPDC059982]|uniref:hypothetical protein n=1 Tax=unclassified Streptomyces TaxID=2593676 RepID=UPI003440869C